MRRSYGVKRDLITIDDDSGNEQPAEKSVRRQAEPPSQEIIELKQKVTKLEKDFRGVCRLSAEAEARVKFLENLLDQKPIVAAEKNDIEKRQIEELKTNLTEVSTQLMEARKEVAGAQLSIEELKERLNCMTLLLNTERDKIKKEVWRVAKLTRQLEAEEAMSREDRRRAQARLEEMTRQENTINRELEKKVAKLTRQLEAEEAMSREDRRRAQTRLEEMTRQENTINRELEKRVAMLTQQLEAEEARSKEDRLRAQKRVDELLHTMAQQALQQQLQPVSDKNIVEPTEAHAPKSSCVQQLQQYSDDEVQPPSIPRRFPTKKLFENHESEKNLPDYRKVAELQMRVASLTRQLEVERAEASENSMKARERMEDMQLRHDEAQQRVLISDDERKRDRNRIDELTRQLAECERSKQQPQQAATSQQTNDGDAPTLPVSAATGTSRPKNIFTPSQSGSSGSIHFQAAVRQLREHYFINDDRWRSSFAEAVAKERHPCNLCNKPGLKGLVVLAHFFSIGHSAMFTPAGSRISLKAFQHWLRILKSIKKPVAIE